MKRFNIIVQILFLLTVMASTVFSQREVVDKIVAVIGDEVILVSELANQIQLVALQTGQQPRTEAEIAKFQKDILDQMISDRLFLIAAKSDTSITIRDQEIETMLEEQVSRIGQNYNSYDEFLNALAAEGLTIRELKKKYRMDVENQLLKQRFIQRKLYSISISKHEVEEFYTKFSDSIPAQPNAVKLAHVLLTITPSTKVLDSIKNRVAELRQMVLDGSDFAAIASQYSSEGAGLNGGDLGYLSQSDVVPEFARAAFNLNVGDISGVIQTQFGFHVIKCEGQKDDRLWLRHILIKISPSAADSQATAQLADSLLKDLWAGGDFEQTAKTYSQDNETRIQGGELGWFASSQLPSEFLTAVTGWKDIGEVRGPIQSRFGIHLLKLLEQQDEKKYTIESDFDHIKELARQDKTGQFVDEWVKELKMKTYISVNVDF